MQFLISPRYPHFPTHLTYVLFSLKTNKSKTTTKQKQETQKNLQTTLGMRTDLECGWHPENPHRAHTHQWKTVSLESSITSGFYKLSSSSPTQIPGSWGKSAFGFTPFNESIPFRTEYFKVSRSLHSAQLQVSTLVPIYCRSSFPDKSSVRHWSVGVAKCHPESLYPYVPLAEWQSSLGFVIYLTFDLWHIQSQVLRHFSSVRHGVNLTEQALKPTRKCSVTLPHVCHCCASI